MELKKFHIGLGGTGNNIVHALVEKTNAIKIPENEVFYINFSLTDISKKFRGKILALDEGGTGKSLERGARIVKENAPAIHEFLAQVNAQFTKKGEHNEVYIYTSLGGGTGSSLTPEVVSHFINTGCKITLVAVSPSPKEKVVTVPNFVKNFRLIYNNFVLRNNLHCTIIFDNELFEKKYKLGTYDYSAINHHICHYMCRVLDDSFYTESSEGFPSLDFNEKKRVQFWGNGLADFMELPVNNGEILKFESALFNGAFQMNHTKAAYCLVRFRDPAEKVSKELIQYANQSIESMTKKLTSAFFVFGYNFGNSGMEKEITFDIMTTGNDAPEAISKDVVVASNAVEKIKEAKEEFRIDPMANLDF